MVTTANQAANLAMLLSAGTSGWVGEERQPARVTRCGLGSWLQRALGMA